MNYQETLDWLFVQLPMYQRQGKAAYKPNLDNTHKLAKHLGNPENKFKSIHVAGTNGKGSTSHMLASVLQEAGYTVGLYTSPHLKDFRERIKINGREVSKQFVIQFVKRNKAFFETERLSFFEMTVGMAFEYFAKKNVDIGIIEVGLGGRLDSTNIITPEVSVITNIGLDHTQFLGNTLPSIAKEKAGIIKKGVPVVVSEFHETTFPIFEAVAKEKSSMLFLAEESVDKNFKTDLLGDYQAKNIKAVVQTIKLLKGFKITEKHIQNGLRSVVANTGLKGRWQILRQAPKVICDTAHNKEGLTLVMEQLGKEHFEKLHIVLGMVNDKDVDAVLPLFPKDAQFYFCAPNVLRGLAAEILKSAAQKHGLKGEVFDTVAAAYDSALQKAKKEDVVYVGGSTFVVAEIV
ncbi:bifunctional folylpolyglutamate synthase/dihydrofolate synthase [Sungkyunkwania multivorans]|uniref:Dihydrofolate synthase/folylpolyglutamate synthase n=1 Tax=Sungkyunkwania multivorans TaxID=1173618 RepID=A0ABW3CYE6_9FLAO